MKEFIEMKGVFGKKLRWVRAAIVAGSLIWSGAAFGYCDNIGWTSRTFNVTFPATMNVSAAPVGGVLASSEVQYVSWGSGTYTACWDSQIILSLTVPDGQLVPGYKGVYKTGVEGIGVRFVFVSVLQQGGQWIPPETFWGGPASALPFGIHRPG
ncbi:hypothetical protein GR157_15840 [Burkholderia sp. 4701]|nr:hypothetical protein [Burkholderia sp. 4701]MXN82928.1 hypothetical protein [Burkholderia sp. 4812]